MVSVTGIILGLIGITILLAPTKPYSDKLSSQIVEWSVYPNEPGTVTSNWAVADLDLAIKIVAGYFVLVAIGLLTRNPSEDEGEVSPLVDTPVKGLQLIYNLVQCVLCGYMIYKAIEQYIVLDYVPICNAFNTKETGMAEVLHLFYLSKILDFCDTLFIVLRKKWRQLSFLHVYHHASIFLFYWLDNLVGYTGDIYLTVVLNSFVHLVMYSYYFLSTLGYSAWWKNYITLLQMGQFIIMNIQAIYILVFKCPYPQRITMAYLFYIISLFLLFRNFYNRTYTKPTGAKGATGPKKSNDSKKGK